MNSVVYYKLYVFVSGFIFFMYLGYIFSYRKNKVMESRFYINIFFSILNTALIFFIIQKIQFINGLSFYETDYGLMALFYMPLVVKFIIGFIILDLMVYWQHRFFHKVPLLWKIHRLHHSDNELDTSTGLRFHPLEAIISLANRLLTVYIFGISPFTLVVFEIILNFASMFNHGNFSLPKNIEEKLRLAIITPDLHRIHHSVDLKDSNHNFGFSISLWDLIFRSYRTSSNLSFKVENIGVLGFQAEDKQSLKALLIQPFS